MEVSSLWSGEGHRRFLRLVWATHLIFFTEVELNLNLEDSYMAQHNVLIILTNRERDRQPLAIRGRVTITGIRPG